MCIRDRCRLRILVPFGHVGREIPMAGTSFVYAAVVTALLALALAVFYARQVLAAPRGNARMVEISDAIREGAMAFLRREYTWVAVFVVVMAALIAGLLPWGRPWGAFAYIFGALLSASAGLVAVSYTH